MLRLPVLVASVLALSVAGAPALAAQEIEGTYRLLPQESDDIGQAINAATSRMNFVTRPIARSRLRGTNPAYQRVVIGQEGARIRIEMDDAPAVVAPRDGTPIRWRRADGEQLDVTVGVEPGRVTQTFRAEDGERENLLVLSPDGRTLAMTVTIRSPQLPEPLTYTLRYRRQ
jgi:hypothetical protein